MSAKNWDKEANGRDLPRQGKNKIKKVSYYREVLEENEIQEEINNILLGRAADSESDDQSQSV